MNRFTTSLRRSLAPCLVLVGAAGIAGCTAQVDVDAGAGGGASTASSAMNTTTTSSSMSSGATGGAGGGGQGGAGGGGSVIGPLACLTGDAAIVAGSSNKRTKVALQIEGTWSQIPGGGLAGSPTQTASYVDVYHRLTVLWTELVAGSSQAHFVGTQDCIQDRNLQQPPRPPGRWIPRGSTPRSRGPTVSLFLTCGHGRRSPLRA